MLQLRFTVATYTWSCNFWIASFMCPSLELQYKLQLKKKPLIKLLRASNVLQREMSHNGSDANKDGHQTGKPRAPFLALPPTRCQHRARFPRNGNSTVMAGQITPFLLYFPTIS
jgi:hypothetical protein